MVKIAKKEYAFTDLEDGDRFYFAGDKKKVVHEVTRDKDGYKVRDRDHHHWQRPTMKQVTSRIIFLRKTETNP
jgi:hypothetical protein